ncbi:Uncharacterized conserved protein YgiM, contains N-terminal SH3 domain, DUF1202 family [Friedmanniella luteola]|uniref:Uncharacterized conserved protein YgiM, contains N-terminal SH3 domain, DUF1202 family n=1 Tax=Friedmanniella luteola TaxID=546871 RepID=A0A1H1ZQ21_9ACTN|nr:SH3 domain-containing protein [Friedmanniella luteola]SDT35743.1 Uncharacterized conserved protein YgiM, contains N-terminal SH3 domain, DUF1202 family [Friedmanniella luteola]
MHVIRAGLRTGAQLLVCAALVVGLLGTAPAAAAVSTATATEALNVRSGPGTTYEVLGTLEQGQKVSTLGTSKGWTAIEFRDAKAYVAAKYLKQATAATPVVSTPAVAPGSLRATTTAVNVRRGAGTSHAVLKVLAGGARVTMTGRTSGGFAEVVLGARTGWVSTRYLKAARGVPAVVGTRVATAVLDIRSTSAARYTRIAEVKKGTRLSITGAVANGRAQVVYAKAARWVTAKYLATPAATQPSVPELPRVTGTRYATATLDIRSTSADRYTAVAEVPRGTALSITGTVVDGRMQIVWNKAARWVTAKYLSTSRPSVDNGAGASVERGLVPNAIKVHRAARLQFPRITTYYGVRPDSIPDHPSGRALDLMLPSYTSASGKALGGQVAAWARANAKALGIQYVIWNQRIWNIQRDKEGWRPMADRGGDSANHKNHVHITVYR